jgi:glucuronate isomerase
MKGPFINDDFLLHSARARELYEGFARDEPILDFHSHLPPRDIAEDRRFGNLFEIWLAGDHYKWRAMRSNGVDERLCTGDASPFEKFMAFARTVPHTLRNPLYHWTHLELKRYFGIEDLLDQSTAASIWERANQMLASEELSVHGILKKFRVKALCTTDDPADGLQWHRRIADSGLTTRVFPTFRPDKALAVNDPESWNAWLERLSAAAVTPSTRSAVGSPTTASNTPLPNRAQRPMPPRFLRTPAPDAPPTPPRANASPPSSCSSSADFTRKKTGPCNSTSAPCATTTPAA